MNIDKIRRISSKVNQILWEEQVTYEEVLEILQDVNIRQRNNKRKSERQEMREEKRRNNF